MGDAEDLNIEALKSLTSNIPDWEKRLDGLSGQIERRQAELAAVTEKASLAGDNGKLAKSIKNRGSTESLKPPGEPEAHPSGDAQAAAAAAAAAARANLLRTLRERHRTNSLVSAEGAAPKYRSRNMIIVYYDSYVQSFFEELVKFVSAGRNLMRKAKMAAKVAHFKRLAQMTLPEDDDDEGGGPAARPSAQPGLAAAASSVSPLQATDAPLEAGSYDGEDYLPELRYVSMQQMRPVSRTADDLFASSTGHPLSARGTRAGYGPPATQPPDAFDELDRGLEYVQRTCEHAAHQFLRDGECNEEITNIKRRLGEVKDLADKEMERLAKDPDALSLLDEERKSRGFRPAIMRKPESPTAEKSKEQQIGASSPVSPPNVL